MCCSKHRLWNAAEIFFRQYLGIVSGEAQGYVSAAGIAYFYFGAQHEFCEPALNALAQTAMKLGEIAFG